MTNDPRAAIARNPMRPLQIIAIGLCIALNALDGFDVLAISFAAPGIAEEWGIERAMLGVVLSMELIGMALGSVLLGQLADRIGRRPTIIGCLCVMASGMLMAAFASDVTTLSVTRLYTGLGIGGMLAATSAMVAEFSNDKRRDFTVMLNIAGYSLGAIVGGVVASSLLALTGDWRTVFLFGGIATTVLLPFVVFWLPESIDSLIARRPSNALARVNAILTRLRMETIDRLPDAPAQAPKATVFALFSPAYLRLTILLTIAYFAQVLAFYYLQKWTPKIIVDLGFDQAVAGGVLVCASIGGLLGAVLLGWLAQRMSVRPLIIGAMLATFAMFAVYGLGHSDIVVLSIVVGVAGFFVNGGVVGMYPIMSRAFPAALRASGTGFAIGVGRGGSALGPVIAGALFAQGQSLLVVSMLMGSGALLAALCLTLLPKSTQSAPGASVAPA